jgi:hypothetical protein
MPDSQNPQFKHYQVFYWSPQPELNRRPAHYKRHSIAQHPYSVNKFKITHPFIPFYGKEYEMIYRKKSWGEDRVTYIDESGQMCSIYTSWTDVIEEDPFVTISNGRCHFRFDDLKKLSSIMKDIKKKKPGVNKNMPHL